MMNIVAAETILGVRMRPAIRPPMNAPSAEPSRAIDTMKPHEAIGDSWASPRCSRR